MGRFRAAGRFSAFVIGFMAVSAISAEADGVADRAESLPRQVAGRIEGHLASTKVAQESQPDFLFYTPPGWESPVVLSSTPGANASGDLFGDRPTYVDVAIANFGMRDATPPFILAVQLDGTIVFSALVPELPALFWIGYEDIEISVSEGSHTIQAVIDPVSPARPEGLIAESDETNNEIEALGEWTAAPSDPLLDSWPPVNLGPLAGNGELPLRLGLDRDAGRLYATNLSTDLVSVADLSTMTVLDAINVGRAPEGIAIDPTARRAYVTCSLAGKLSMVNLDSNLVIGETPIGTGASALVLEGGIVYVHIETHNTIAVVDGTDGSLLQLIPFYPLPIAGSGAPSLFSALALDPESERLFASVSPPPGGPGTLLAVIPLAGGSPTTFDTGGELRDLAYDSLSHRLYATLANDTDTGLPAVLAIYDAAGGLVFIDKAPLSVPVALELEIDPLLGGVFISGGTAGGVLRVESDGTELTRFGPDEQTRGLVVDATGERLYAANASLARVNVFDIGFPQIEPVDRATLGKRLRGGAFDPTANRFFAVGFEGETISEIDGNGGSLTGTFTLDPKIVDITVHPTTGAGYAIREGQPDASTVDQLLMLDLTLRTITASVDLPGVPRLIGLDPLLDRVYVALEGTNPLLVFDAATLAPGTPLADLVEPRDLAVDSGTGDIFVVEPMMQRLRKIDPDTGDAEDVFGIGGTSETGNSFLALDQGRGLAYVAGDWEEPAIQVVDTITLQILPLTLDASVVPLAGSRGDNRNITGIAVNEQMNLVYVSLLGNVVFHPSNLLVFDGATGVLIGQRETGGGPFRPILDANLGRLYVTNLFSGEVSIFDVPGYTMSMPPPPAPTGLSADAGDGRVAVQWEAEAEAAGYRLFRRPAGQPPFLPVHPSLLPASATRYADTGVTNGLAYEYMLRGVNALGVEGEPAILESPVVPSADFGGPGFKLTSLRISASGNASQPARYTLQVPYTNGLREPIQFTVDQPVPFADITFEPRWIRGPGTVLMEVIPLESPPISASIPFEVLAQSGEYEDFLPLFLEAVPESGSPEGPAISFTAPPITILSDSDLMESELDQVAIKGRLAADVDFSAVNMRVEKADGGVEYATGVVVHGGLFAQNFQVSSASQLGLWRVTVSWAGDRSFVGRNAHSFTLPVGGGNAASFKPGGTLIEAIEGVGETVIVGSRPGPAADQATIDALSNLVYDTLQARRFTDETLAVLSNSTQASGYDAPSSIASLSSAVATAAGSNPLTVYLIGETDTAGEIPLNPSETLTAAQLKGMLDPYVATQTQVIILDCQYAASFIDVLAGPNRAVIASTGRTGPAALSPPSSSFTRFFLDILEAEGASLSVALQEAGDILRLRERTFGSQIPEGSFQPSTLGDLTLGSLFAPPSEPIPDKIPPQITEVGGSVIESVGTPVTLWARVEDDTDAAQDLTVQALIQREGGGESQVLSLVYSATTERFEAEVPANALPGHYGVTFQAIDSSDNSSGLVLTGVVILPDIDLDGAVTASDLYRAAAEVRSASPGIDFTADGQFDYLDLFRMATHWGEAR